MNTEMFCYQCEQVANGIVCKTAGVCGKNAYTSNKQDTLVCEMIGLATILEKGGVPLYSEAVDLIVDGLFATATNVSFDIMKIQKLMVNVRSERERLAGEAVFKSDQLFQGDENIVSLRSTMLFGLRGMAAYAHHARILDKRDPAVDEWFIKGMAALGKEHTIAEWLDLLMEFGSVNLKCMALLDTANTNAFGNPEPTQVSLKIEKGPAIVISGHDLRDLKMLLEQTNGMGINIYTHGEMLPAHGYPELKKYSHLKGHFGTAWQNQQREFANIPFALVFTSNCLMPPKPSYADRVFTTSVVGFPGMRHIESEENGYKDFTQVIDRATNLQGFAKDMQFVSSDGSNFTHLTTGFGRQAILDNAPAIIDAVKSGNIKHFFLVGGCDGLKKERNYYTDFVKKTPKDTIVLTLACGKFRFNYLDIGNIGPFPRILDMGQCNDAYGAVQVAVALAGAFNCDVNDLPLTLVLSWYEQKAVCILLTLLHLGIKNIYIGPTLPAFFSDAVISVLVEKFDLHPISTPEQDLAEILNR